MSYMVSYTVRYVPYVYEEWVSGLRRSRLDRNKGRLTIRLDDAGLMTAKGRGSGNHYPPCHFYSREDLHNFEFSVLVVRRRNPPFSQGQIQIVDHAAFPSKLSLSLSLSLSSSALRIRAIERIVITTRGAAGTGHFLTICHEGRPRRSTTKDFIHRSSEAVERKNEGS